MISTHSPIYRKAFEQYLRKGTPIEVFLKAVETTEHHSTPLYRWHTAGDAKVRASHAANNGKIFAWNHPPATGNPGERINCRCWAEPVEVDTTPLEIIALLSGAGILRRVGIRVGGEIVRRIERGREAPLTKPAEPPPLSKPDGIPKHWGTELADKKEGIKYIDPKNRGNDVRVQRGNLSSQWRGQQRDYVKWKKNGHWLDKYGKPVSGDSPEAHIPIEEFKFDPELFK